MDTREKKEIGRIRRVFCSIRTQSALVTAFFLLVALGMFYVGGRIVLVHFISDTEQQVRDIGRSITDLAYRQVDAVRAAARQTLERPGADRASARALLSDFGQDFSLVAVFTPKGELTEGVLRDLSGTVGDLRSGDLSNYAHVISDWIAVLGTSDAGFQDRASSGIIRLDGRLHYVILQPRGGVFVMFGQPFAATAFLGREHGSFGGMEIHIGTRRRASARRGSGWRTTVAPEMRSRYGIAPMFSEAMEFYSGGFWKLRDNPLEAVFAIRDIAGVSVTSVSVALPKKFTGATRMAVWRLSFFIAIGGILFVLPLFWAQNRILLNPLTKMTATIRRLSEQVGGVDCPRLEWEGRNEFAQLAESVNRMIETIAARTVSLANAEASHQALLDGVPDALVVFDPDGRLVSVSKQPGGAGSLPGFFPGEPPAAAVFGEGAVAKFLEAVRTVCAEGTIGRVRLETQRPFGAAQSERTRHFELRLSRLGKRFVLAIVRDISAEVSEHLLRLEAERKVLDAMKRESLTNFAAGIAHDMNNVLSVVLNAAEAEGADPSGDSVKTLGTIRDAVRRGSSMMRELMTYAGENRVTLMRAAPRLVMEDIRQLASRVVGANIVLSIDAAEGAPDVDVDPNQFWKVLFNIIKNAGEAIGARPGRIELSAEAFSMTKAAAATFVSESPLAEGPGTIFRIEDDGPGIRPDLLGRIFDPYVSSKSLGRGLGLATVRTIIEAHGGGIRVESRLDHGTTFSIFLPVSKLPVPAVDETRGEEPGAPVAGDVLIIDNDEAILKTTSILLKAMKLSPHVARDRRESLAVIRRHASGLRAIILDANLGGIDTVRLLGAFRIGAPKVPVIVSSGSAEESIAKMFKAHPYDAFLAKPYTVAELREAVFSAGHTPA